MQFTYENLNQASIGLCRKLLHLGVRRKTRGFDCVEIQEPVLVCIMNPTDRYINIKERKNHKVLPFAESLALASGVNSMDLYASYVPNMMMYSDDGKHQRAGYGTRIRAFTGYSGDYQVSDIKARRVHSGGSVVVDQLRFVIETLRKDINSRQALITIHDPGKDCFTPDNQLLVTKDQPCSRSLQFMVVNGKLDCTLLIRSNDLLYGFQAVNVFNFTWMQEYIANILGLEVGRYFHFANNLHYYEDKRALVETIADLRMEDYESQFGVWQYPNQTKSLDDFDKELENLFYYEKNIRLGLNVIHETDNIMFSDWGKVFYRYWTKKQTTFANPYLNKLFL